MVHKTKNKTGKQIKIDKAFWFF